MAESPVSVAETPAATEQPAAEPAAAEETATEPPATEAPAAPPVATAPAKATKKATSRTAAKATKATGAGAGSAAGTAEGVDAAAATETTDADPGKAEASRATPAKATGSGPAKVPPRTTRSAAETEKIRVALSERRDELKAEYEQTMAEIAEAQRDRLTDSAGDDQADTGTKTFEREQEISLANNVRERVAQVERALDRLDDGQYGWCERCGNAIPVERLAAFPSATLCVSCKQLEERR
jgi:RNA polymerase-binding protein DksA